MLIVTNLLILNTDFWEIYMLKQLDFYKHVVKQATKNTLKFYSL